MLPPPQPQPSSASRTPSLLGRLKSLELGTKIGLAASAIVLACAACGSCAIVAAVNSPSSGGASHAGISPTISQTASAATTATTVPTKAPTTAPTRVPSTATTAPVAPLANSATLGGTFDAFTARLGAPYNQPDANTNDYQQCLGVATAGVIAQNYLSGNGRVDGVTVSSCDDDWTLSQAESHFAPYLPPDAQKRRSVTVASPTGGDTEGLDVIFFSASLAKVLPTDEFTDANNNPVQPGTFDVFYLYGSGSGGTVIDSAQLFPGTQQTAG